MSRNSAVHVDTLAYAKVRGDHDRLVERRHLNVGLWLICVVRKRED